MSEGSKNKCNEDFFSHNTPQSFYWAGFIAADGCVHKNAKNIHYLHLELGHKDYDHLSKFVRCIKYDGKILKNNKSCRVNIASYKIYNDLSKFNIVPRKTLIYTFPEWVINHSLVNHFMRGYFDGDGSFYTRKSNYKTKTKQLCANLRGTKTFLETYRNILCENGAPTESNIKIYDGIGKLAYSGTRKCINFRNFLYTGADNEIMLKRKYDIAFGDEFVNIPDNLIAKPVIAVNIRDNKMLSFESISEAAKNGFDKSTIIGCCNGKFKQHKGFTWRYK